MQISLQLDTKLCDNIEASGATVAEAGGKKQLNYTVLPGKGAEYSVTADVRDFKMDAVTLNAIKLAMDLDIDYGKVSEQTKQLVSAIGSLDDGAGELLGGAKQLSDGMSRYMDGMAR